MTIQNYSDTPPCYTVANLTTILHDCLDIKNDSYIGIETKATHFVFKESKQILSTSLKDHIYIKVVVDFTVI